MGDKQNRQQFEVEIDIGRVFRAIVDRAWRVAMVSVLCAVIALGYTRLFVTPQYQSSAMFYIYNNAYAVGDASLSISSGDLVTSRDLVDSYIVILKTRETLTEVIEHTGADLTVKELGDMISAEAVDETEVFRVTVTHPDPLEAEKIASAIAQILPGRISDIIDGTSAKIVDHATVPERPSSPSLAKNTLAGFLLGFMASAGVIVLREVFDTTIRSEEDIAQVCPHPVLSQVPDMQAGGRKRSYGYSAEKKQGSASRPRRQNGAFIGSNVSFVAAEAYKRLRTMLQFSFADDSSCRVIGLSSPLSGEGKSLTAVNLAYSLAQLNKRVILLDCDMRRPTLAEKTGLAKKPGLSECLTGQHKFKDVVQRYCKGDETVAFHVVSAGENPPNPLELLSSQRMERLIDGMRDIYDYIILDLPPVTEVTDALAMGTRVDGMLLVVRQDYCDRGVLNETVQKFSFVGTRILGVVFNCTSEHTGKYYRQRYYKRSAKDEKQYT